MSILYPISIPFLGTTLGAAMVYIFKDKISSRLEKVLLGFASGVMVAASVWSLLIPSLESTTEGLTWLPTTIGFLLGTGFLLLLDVIIPHLHLNENQPEGLRSNFSKTTMMLLAVTLHNIPEGMAVGVAFASSMHESTGISMAASLALSIGIALQNFPEGAIVSLPLKAEGMSKHKSFLLGTLSGIVEPIASIVTILFVEQMLVVLPYLLAFAAGAMIYVVVEELIPEAQNGKHSNLSTIAFAIGFVCMMILDVALG